MNRVGDDIMFRHIHRRLMDAIQGGRDEDAFVFGRLLAWFAKRKNSMRRIW